MVWGLPEGVWGNCVEESKKNWANSNSIINKTIYKKYCRLKLLLTDCVGGWEQINKINCGISKFWYSPGQCVSVGHYSTH